MTSLHPTVRRLLEIRRDLSLSSVAKYDTFDIATTDDDPWLRGCFQFYGAQRTGRYAGRLIQPHNLPARGVESRPEVLGFLREWIKKKDLDLIELTFGSLSEGLKAGIRPTITAPKGYKIVVADLSSIEAVKTGWVSNCEPILNTFKSGKDIYTEFATRMFRVSYKDVTKKQRTTAKPPVLGCGFGLGAGTEEKEVWNPDKEKYITEPATGLIAYAKDIDVDLSVSQAKDFVEIYRHDYAEVRKCHKALEKTFKHVLKHRDSGSVKVGPIEIFYRKPAARIVLPSGRHLIYMQPAVQPRRTPWGEIKPTITYMNYDGTKRSWYRHKTHGGKTFENVVQAIARDYFTHGMLLAEAEGFILIGHMHDELITLVPINDNSLTISLLVKCLAKNPYWCRGSPVKAEGWEGDFYRKE